MSDPTRWMRRALALARRAPHRVSPNPMVGCVLVRDGVVVGEGVTRPVGGAHAEVVALEHAGEQARGATAYVTLEPCCHHGRTPPCTEALIAAGVARVEAGVIDPNPIVAGRGLDQLRSAGVEVGVGLLESECAAQIAPFRRFIENGRPWVVLKAATTLDGRIATADGDSRWITGEAARRDVHRMRARVDAVMVGGGTARADDPRLNVRGVRGADPLRVILATTLDLPEGARALAPGSVVFHGPDAPAARIDAVSGTGAQPIEVGAGPGGLLLDEVLAALAARGVVRLLVEGGGQLHGGLLAARLADEAVWYVAPRLVGEGRPVVAAPSAATIDAGWALEDVSTRRLGDDVRIRGRIVYPAAP